MVQFNNSFSFTRCNIIFFFTFYIIVSPQLYTADNENNEAILLGANQLNGTI